MHKAAEFGIAAHWKYKEASDGKKVEAQEEEKLAWLRQILEWQTDMSDNREFMNLLKSDLDLFSDSVYCFTPTGEVKNLPYGSTPIDFAYAIHSAVGNRMVGARVNGKLVTIDYHINNGDRIEIITSQNSKGPSRDWLKLAKSTQAKNKINQWFKKEFKEDNIVKGKEMFAAYCKAKAIDITTISKPDYMSLICKKYGFHDWDNVLAAIGHGGLKEGQIINRMVEAYERDHKKVLTDAEVIAAVEENAQNKSMRPQKSKSGIIVKGIDDVAVRFSRCCNPVPGDEIVGFVTRGRGVTIHRTDCVNVINLSNEERGRLIESEWDTQFAKGDTNASYLAEVRVTANDRVGLILEISRQLADDDISVKGFNVRTTKDMLAIFNVTIEIKTKEQLERVVKRLKALRDIVEVERVSGLG